MECFNKEIAPPMPFHLGRTAWLFGMGRFDPTINLADDSIQVAMQTPEGGVTIAATHFRNRASDSSILRVECYGDGNKWIAERVPSLFGFEDQLDQFQPTGKLGQLAKQLSGARLPKLPVVFHRLVQIVLQQLVSWSDALHGWKTIVQRYGEDAPGPFPLRLPPTADRLSKLAYFDLVECGVLPRQARIILHLAKEANRIERLASKGPDDVSKVLLAIPGIGSWTVEHLLGTSLGVADAVLIGDYGLPHTVAWFFNEQARSNDDEMLQLLEPYRGDRFRVINLLWQSGINAPRRGPKRRSNRARF